MSYGDNSVLCVYMSPFNMICHILTSSSHQSVICLNVIVYLESLFANRGNCSMVMFKPELVSNDEIRVNNSGCSTVIVLNCLVREEEITIKITFVDLFRDRSTSLYQPSGLSVLVCGVRWSHFIFSSCS